jgi:hypothetical protein
MAEEVARMTVAHHEAGHYVARYALLRASAHRERLDRSNVNARIGHREREDRPS